MVTGIVDQKGSDKYAIFGRAARAVRICLRCPDLSGWDENSATMLQN